jgi:PAS domain S-box-containing protein
MGIVGGFGAGESSLPLVLFGAIALAIVTWLVGRRALAWAMPSCGTPGSLPFRWLAMSGTPSSPRPEPAQPEANKPSVPTKQELQAILEHAPDVIVKFDRQARHLFISPAVERLTGIPREVFLGKTLRETGLLPEYDEGWDKAFDAVLRTGQPQEVELGIKTPSPQYYQARLVPETRADGYVEAIVMVARDVTEQKLAEDALGLRVELLRMAEEAGRVGCYVWEFATGCARVSPIYLNVMGLPDNMLILPIEAWRARVHPDDLAGTLEYLQQEFAQQAPYATSVYRVVYPDGTVHWIEARGKVSYDAEGHPLRMIGVNLDITEHKQAEAALEHRNQRLAILSEVAGRLLANDNPRAVVRSLCEKVMAHLDCQAFLYYLEDPKSGRLQLEASAGLPEELAQKIAWLDSPAVFEDSRASCCERAGPHLEEPPVEVRTELAAEGFKTLVCHPLVIAGHARGAICFGSRVKEAFAEDESAMMQAVADHVAIAIERAGLLESLEQQVAQRTAVAEHRAQQLRRLTAEITQSEERERRRLAHVLHDHLLQMLAATRLKTTLLRRRPLDDRQTQLLGDIDDLLSECLSEARSITEELSPPVLYDGGLEAGLLWLARRLREKHELEVLLAMDPEAGCIDQSLQILLFQVIRELLRNIVRHAQVASAEITVTRGREHVRVEVRDNGLGFDPTRLEQQANGSGFGLFSIRERLEMIGGRMEINSEPGHGTRVVLLAPLEASQPESQ